MKGTGPRKLQKALSSNYCGNSESHIRSTLDKDSTYRHLNARFRNKPLSKPIRAKCPQERHQIDLMDMSNSAVKYKGKTYKYILSILDVFIRFCWLRPLENRASETVAEILAQVYYEHGPPKVLQHDRGTEFKVAVKGLMSQLHVKVITSAPYHPQSQGKVERIHRQLRKKIMYDLLHSAEGSNWVQRLPEYNSIMNEETREELGYRSPSQIYFGRSRNRFPCDERQVIQETTQSSSDVAPGISDFRRFEKRRSSYRHKAKSASKRCEKRQIARGLRSNPPSVYSVGDTVLLKYKHTKHKVPKRYHILKGEIVKRNRRLHRYKIQYRPPSSKDIRIDWFPVSHITSLTQEREDIKQAESKSKSKSSKSKSSKSSFRAHKAKYYVPYSIEEELLYAEGLGLNIDFNPLPDGNCQFEAVSHALQRIGIHRSGETLRHDVVQDLSERPHSLDGTHF